MIIDKLYEHRLCKTPEGLAVWITAQSQMHLVRFPSGVWHRDNPLDRRETATIAKILREGTSADAIDNEVVTPATSISRWSNKVHFVWDLVCSCLLRTLNSAEQSRSGNSIKFIEFWEACVDSM